MPQFQALRRPGYFLHFDPPFYASILQSIGLHENKHISQIIDYAKAQHWKLTEPDIEVAITLMKAYKTILNKHVENKSLADAIQSRFNEKA